MDPRGVSAGGSPTGRSVNFAIPCKINDLRAVFHVLRQPARTDRARPDMRPACARPAPACGPPMRPGAAPHAPGLTANPAPLDRPGHGLTPAHWSARGQIDPRPLARQTCQQTTRGIDPPGPQNRPKRAANRAGHNAPGLTKTRTNRGNPGKVSKCQLTCQTQKNPARGRDRLGLAGQIRGQKSATGNCTMLAGSSD